MPPIPSTTTATCLKVNPHLLQCPNFASNDFSFIRDAVQSANNLSSQDAINQLVQDWTSRNSKERDIWDAHMHQVQQAQDRATDEARLQVEKEKETERKEREKKRPKLGNFDPLLKVSKEQEPILHPYALKQPSDFKYCPLWYFTKTASIEASDVVNSLTPDTMNLLQDTASGSLSFQASSTVTPSKNARSDKDLSWSQFSYAFSWFLRAIGSANWPEKTVQMFTTMFLNLTLHPFRQRSNGKTTLLVYADETRRQWHRDIEGGKSGPNLSEIVAERLENISNDLHDQSMVSSPMLDASGSDSRYYTTTDSENNNFEYYSRPQSLSPFQDDSYEHSECLNESTTPENMYHSPYDESQGDDFEDSAYNTIFPENL